MGRYVYAFDWTYLMVLATALLCIIASAGVKRTFNKYSKIRSTSGLTGAQVAERILRKNGIMDVSINHISGTLTDHYDPRTKSVNLSDAVYASQSVAAIGVAAHECGHVIQHQHAYGPLKIRTALVPAANIGSKIGIPIIILGFILSLNKILITIGIWVFAASVLFQLVTLPVEFNASNRAVHMLEDYGILSSEELPHSKAVLKAAAMTYVASAAAAVVQLLRFVLLANRRR